LFNEINKVFIKLKGSISSSSVENLFSISERLIPKLVNSSLKPKFSSFKSLKLCNCYAYLSILFWEESSFTFLAISIKFEIKVSVFTFGFIK
jgi:hypothetical protein